MHTGMSLPWDRGHMLRAPAGTGLMRSALELQIRGLDPCHAAALKEPAARLQAPCRIVCVAPNHWACTGLQ